MRRGAKIIVPGDGTSIWTLTHNTDFAKGLIGLLGQPAAWGEDFHITSSPARTISAASVALANAGPVLTGVVTSPRDAHSPARGYGCWSSRFSFFRSAEPSRLVLC